MFLWTAVSFDNGPECNFCNTQQSSMIKERRFRNGKHNIWVGKKVAKAPCKYLLYVLVNQASVRKSVPKISALEQNNSGLQVRHLTWPDLHIWCFIFNFIKNYRLTCVCFGLMACRWLWVLKCPICCQNTVEIDSFFETTETFCNHFFYLKQFVVLNPICKGGGVPESASTYQHC